MREIAIGSQSNQNLSRFRWKVKGKRRDFSLHNAENFVLVDPFWRRREEKISSKS